MLSVRAATLDNVRAADFYNSVNKAKFDIFSLRGGNVKLGLINRVVKVSSYVIMILKKIMLGF